MKAQESLAAFSEALRESAFATYEEALAFIEWHDAHPHRSSWDETRYEQAIRLRSLRNET